MINREIYMKRIRGFMNHPDLVKVITGVRRCGKSVLLQIIQNELLATGVLQENIISYNFEDLSLRSLSDGYMLHDHIKKQISKITGRVYLFLDEIQEVDKWEKCVNSLRVSSDIDIYVTGSNATMLSGEHAAYLSGRYVEVEMFPLSFREFYELKMQNNSTISKDEVFKQYVLVGGMPFVARIDNDEQMVKQYLNDLFSSVVVKDIMKRNSFRDIDLLERLISYIMGNIGTTFSAFSISRFFKSENRAVSADTVLNYIKACEQAFLFYRVPWEDVEGKRLLQVNEKFYACDHGLREATYGKNEKDIGLVLENIVYMELLRRGYKVAVGRIDGHEIDFVCDRSGERIYIQVTYILADERTIEREFGVYREVSDNFPKMVISMDQFDLSREGVLHKNIIDFLMNT